MKALLSALIVLSTILLISSCGGSSEDSASGASGASGADSSAVTLRWTPPTQRSNGSPLAVNELASYRIYYGTSRAQMTDFIEIDATENMSSYTLIFNTNGLLDNTLYALAMTTIDSQGIESDWSEIILSGSP